MSASRDAPSIEYAIGAAGDADAMARLLGDTFSHRDPPAVAVGLTAPEFQAFARLYCARAAVEGLTVVARHAGTRALVGVLLTEDAAASPPVGIERLSPKFAPIFDLLGRLDAEYRGGRPGCPGEALHLPLLGVAAPAAGQSVAQHLVATCLAHGAGRGCRRAVTEATNPTSQHVFRKQEFTERVRQSYRHHTVAGRAAFASSAALGGAILMDRALPAGGPPHRAVPLTRAPRIRHRRHAVGDIRPPRSGRALGCARAQPDGPLRYRVLIDTAS